eukprot:gb/GECH01003486.1/.p1 GENE.gb/GECH01003486.1/~~gb/GECH01003486.1/.p1  ORF type:complete len:216 (+),score=39.01 gb/GECH01003486.1/:1-648(+)
MSKIASDQLREALEAISNESKANFKETIDLQIRIKNFDFAKERRVSCNVRLPNVARPGMKICVLADAAHIDECKKQDIPYRSVEDLKKLKKDKKLVKKLAKSFDAFLASESLIKQIPRILGPGLNKAGKFPTMLAAKDDLPTKMKEIQSSIKLQMKKKELCVGAAVGTVETSHEDLIQNITFAVNALVAELKKHWQNIGTVTIKRTMGKPHSIYP